jgi:hypothetical protein
MTDIDKIDRLQATIAELRKEKEKLYINVANRDAEIERLTRLLDAFHDGRVEPLLAEIERLNIRIRQDAEAALRHLNEIDRLREQVAALEEKV